jgi:TonB family protein
MALTGQLSDMSLAELIEFFCNQRKTGRLKIDYPRGHSVFFIKDGELVDAKVGLLSGEEAVYFSLTLPNAAFDFSPEVLPTRRTISQSWTQVVLEGLRRLDEGLSPSEADAFGAWSPSDADVSHMFEQVDRLGAAGQSKASAKEKEEDRQEALPSSSESSEVPLSLMVDGASGDGGGKKKWLVMGVAASLVLVCAVAAIPLSGRLGSKSAASSSPAASQPAPPAPASPAPSDAAPSNPSPESSEAAPAEAAPVDSAAAEEARREALAREARERRERERRAEERARRENAAEGEGAAATPKPVPVAPSGPKSVRVTVTYDEAGRVTQASVAGSTPGAEAYGGTAVRIARGKRFPAGKAGSTVVTIPVN